jgi:hypothetical protein
VAVTNEEEFKAWLEGQPREVCVAIAYRAAMRVLPLATQATRRARANRREREKNAALANLRVAISIVAAAVGSRSNSRNWSDLSTVSDNGFEGSFGACVAVASAYGVARSRKNARNARAEKALREEVAMAARSAAWAAEECGGFSAKSAFWFSTYADTDLGPVDLMAVAIEVPEKLEAAIARYAEGKTDLLQAGGPWTFWAEWYRRAMAGDPLPWDLQEQIALIPNEIWEAGPEAVTARIEKIQHEFHGEPLDQDALRTHAKSILQSPSLHADAALSAANLIENAVATYKREVPTNSLPDGFERFEDLSARFGGISVVLLSDRSKDEKIEALQAQINALHAEKLALQRALSDAQARLRDARLDKLEVAQMRTFGEKLNTTLSSVTVLGAIGLGLLNFFGVSAEDVNYDGFKSLVCGLAEDMCAARPSEDVADLPPDTEV